MLQYQSSLEKTTDSKFRTLLTLNLASYTMLKIAAAVSASLITRRPEEHTVRMLHWSHGQCVLHIFPSGSQASLFNSVLFAASLLRKRRCYKSKGLLLQGALSSAEAIVWGAGRTKPCWAVLKVKAWVSEFGRTKRPGYEGPRMCG